MDAKASIQSSQQNRNDASSTQLPNQLPPMTAPYQFGTQAHNYQFGTQAHNYQFPTMPTMHPFRTQLSFQDLLTNPNIPPEITHFSTRPIDLTKNYDDAEKLCSSETEVANKKWSTIEDVALTKAWLYVSVDADVGNGQKGATMWKRIHQEWKEHMGHKCTNARTPNSLQCRWTDIQAAVQKFNSHYERFLRNPESGTNAEKMKKDAFTIYKAIYKKEFKYEHCWEIMIKNPKWCIRQNELRKKKEASKVKDLTEETTCNPKDEPTMGIQKCDSLNNDEIPRPEGRKASKENKRKAHDAKGVVDALNKLQCTLETQIIKDQEEKRLKKEKEDKEFELRQQIVNKEIELKENAQKLKMKDQEIKEEAQRIKKKDQEMREKAQRRIHQDRLMNQDLTKLSPEMQLAFENYRVQILKEWENDGLLGGNI